MLKELALIPLVPVVKALIGLVEDEPNVPKVAGPKEAGEKAPPKVLLDIAAIGDILDIELIGLENE